MRQSISQKINKAAFDQLIEEKYAGKHRRLAEAIGMSHVQMWRIITEKASPGSDFMFRFTEYCDANKLDRNNFFTKTESTN